MKDFFINENSSIRKINKNWDKKLCQRLVIRFDIKDNFQECGRS